MNLLCLALIVSIMHLCLILLHKIFKVMPIFLAFVRPFSYIYIYLYWAYSPRRCLLSIAQPIEHDRTNQTHPTELGRITLFKGRSSRVLRPHDQLTLLTYPAAPVILHVSVAANYPQLTAGSLPEWLLHQISTSPLWSAVTSGSVVYGRWAAWHHHLLGAEAAHCACASRHLRLHACPECDARLPPQLSLRLTHEGGGHHGLQH
jgi:hypothetical protein